MPDKMSSSYFLYRIDKEGDAQIYCKFPSLQMAKMSADLLMIKDVCFILSGDFTKLYFYEDENKEWTYDILTEKGRLEFFDVYPKPDDVD